MVILASVAAGVVMGDIVKMVSSEDVVDVPNGAAVKASRVCVANQAGFNLGWNVHDLQTGTDGPASGNYPIDQTRCNTIPTTFTQGHLLSVVIHAVAGKTQAADTSIEFHAGAPAVTITCRGATLTYHCTMNTENNEELASDNSTMVSV